MITTVSVSRDGHHLQASTLSTAPPGWIVADAAGAAGGSLSLAIRRQAFEGFVFGCVWCLRIAGVYLLTML